MALNVSTLEGGENVCHDFFLDVTPALGLVNICVKDINHNPCPVVNNKPCLYGIAARMERKGYLNGSIKVPVLESAASVG